MGLATRMMHDADEAEDIVQNASIAAIEAVRADPAKAERVRRPSAQAAGGVPGWADRDLTAMGRARRGAESAGKPAAATGVPSGATTRGPDRRGSPDRSGFPVARGVDRGGRRSVVLWAF